MENIKKDFSGGSDLFEFNRESGEDEKYIITSETTLEDIEDNVEKYFENDLELESDLLTLALKKIYDNDSKELISILMAPGIREKLEKLDRDRVTQIIRKIKGFEIDEKGDNPDDENEDPEENDGSFESGGGSYIDMNSIRERWGGRKTLDDVVQERIKDKYGLDLNDLKTGSEADDYQEKHYEESGRVQDYIELLSQEYLDDIIGICDGDGDVKAKIGEIIGMLSWILDRGYSDRRRSIVFKEVDSGLFTYGRSNSKDGVIINITDEESKNGNAIYYVNTVVHELWHEHQREVARDNSSIMSRAYRESLKNSVSGGVDYFRYRANIREKEAFYAGDIVAYRLLDRYFNKSKDNQKYYDYFLGQDDASLKEYGAKFPHEKDALRLYHRNSFLPEANNADEYYEMDTMIRSDSNYMKYVYQDLGKE